MPLAARGLRSPPPTAVRQAMPWGYFREECCTGVLQHGGGPPAGCAGSVPPGPTPYDTIRHHTQCAPGRHTARQGSVFGVLGGTVLQSGTPDNATTLHIRQHTPTHPVRYALACGMHGQETTLHTRQHTPEHLPGCNQVTACVYTTWLHPSTGRGAHLDRRAAHAPSHQPAEPHASQRQQPLVHIRRLTPVPRRPIVLPRAFPVDTPVRYAV